MKNEKLMEMAKQLNGTYLHRTFLVKFLPCTNTRGSRVKIIDCNFDGSIILSYDYEFRYTTDQAIYFLLEKGFDVEGVASANNNRDILICCKWTAQRLKK